MRLLLTRLSALAICLMSADVLVHEQTESATVTAVPLLVRVTSSFHPSGGEPAAAMETITLSVYAEENGGAPLWEETQAVAVNPDGRFTLLMGSTRPDGLPLDLFASGQARWLAIHVERPGEGEPGRVLLARAPYGLSGSDADTPA